MSDDFLRYAEECRRMARLSRDPRPRAVVTDNQSFSRRIAEWLAELQAYASAPAGYHPEVARGRSVRR